MTELEIVPTVVPRGCRKARPPRPPPHLDWPPTSESPARGSRLLLSRFSTSAYTGLLLAQPVQRTAFTKPPRRLSTVSPAVLTPLSFPLLGTPPSPPTTSLAMLPALRSTAARAALPRFPRQAIVRFQSSTAAASSSGDYTSILVSTPAPGVSQITLNRPKALNGAPHLSSSVLPSRDRLTAAPPARPAQRSTRPSSTRSTRPCAPSRPTTRSALSSLPGPTRPLPPVPTSRR